MKKFKVIILAAIMLMVMSISMVGQAATSEEVVELIHGRWSDRGYEFYIDHNYFNGWECTVEQAYIDGPFLYAWLKMKNGGMTAIRAWKIKDAGPVYNALDYWNASKSEDTAVTCLRTR